VRSGDLAKLTIHHFIRHVDQFGYRGFSRVCALTSRLPARHSKRYDDRKLPSHTTDRSMADPEQVFEAASAMKFIASA